MPKTAIQARRDLDRVTCFKKSQSIGARATIAVSSSGFSEEAKVIAKHYGIELRQLNEVSVSDINGLIRLDFVLFTHKRCCLVRAGVCFFQDLNWRLPDWNSADFIFPRGTNPFLPLFRSLDTDATWSLNDLWRQLQEATDPFVDIEMGSKPVARTVCFPYPGIVAVDMPTGSRCIRNVLLSLALSLEIEKVSIEDARN